MGVCLAWVLDPARVFAPLVREFTIYLLHLAFFIVVRGKMIVDGISKSRKGNKGRFGTDCSML